MIGVESVASNTGCPYAGGGEVEFCRDNVRRLGKLRVWGSQACVQFVAELLDGRSVFVNASKQVKEDEKWLRRVAKWIPRCYVSSRAEGWRITWADVVPENRA